MRDAGSTSEIIRLYAALDERRRALGLSWQQFAHEIGHVSPSTLSGMPSRRVIEADGALQMLRWLGCSAESLLTPPRDGGPPLPPVRRGQILRVDVLGWLNRSMSSAVRPFDA